MEWLLISIDLTYGRYNGVDKLRVERFPTEAACLAKGTEYENMRNRPTTRWDEREFHKHVCTPVARIN